MTQTSMEDLTQTECGTVLSIPASVTLRSAPAFRDAILNHLKLGRSLAIDCGALAEADLSLLQLIVALRKSAAQRGVPVSLIHPDNKAFLQLLIRAGFVTAPAGDPDTDDLFWLQGSTQS